MQLSQRAYNTQDRGQLVLDIRGETTLYWIPLDIAGQR